MALPRNCEARLFYRVARQRIDDAQFLFDGDRTTGAVYLAGYSVECMLKALILERRIEADESGLRTHFRGVQGHNLELLRTRCKENVTYDVATSFSIVSYWNTDLRHQPGTLTLTEAKIFLDAARKIISWADGRL